MNKLIIFIMVSLLLVGCTNNNTIKDNQPPVDDIKDNKNDTKAKVPVKDLINEFKDRLIVDTYDDGRVKDFKTKEELINNLSQIISRDVAKEYVDIFYREKDNKTYLLSTDGPLLLYFNIPYELIKKDGTTYYAVQENETQLHGKYKLTVIFKYEDDEWIIEDIKVDFDQVAETDEFPDDIPEDNVSDNLKSILILVNKNNSISPDYIPPKLREPDVKFSFEEDLPKRLLRSKAAKALENMFQRAKKDDISLYAVSGYRSYNRQKAIFDYKSRLRGEEEANKFSAKPGESEHQTGLAMDVTSRSANFNLVQYFGKTKEGKWIEENSSSFGFIIRYPKGKEHITGYSYEPWHLRYVGEDAAKYIDKNNITLEEYLNLEINTNDQS